MAGTAGQNLPYALSLRLNAAEHRAIEIVSEREDVSMSSAARSLIQAGFIADGLLDQLVAEGVITAADPEQLDATQQAQLSGLGMPARVARREPA